MLRSSWIFCLHNLVLVQDHIERSGTEKVMHYCEARSALMIFLINTAAQRLSRIDRITGACICICICISRICRSNHRGLYDAGGRACQPSESAKWAANTVDFGQNNQNQAFPDMQHMQWIHYAYMVTFYYFANTSNFLSIAWWRNPSLEKNGTFAQIFSNVNIAFRVDQIYLVVANVRKLLSKTRKHTEQPLFEYSQTHQAATFWKLENTPSSHFWQNERKPAEVWKPCCCPDNSRWTGVVMCAGCSRPLNVGINCSQSFSIPVFSQSEKSIRWLTWANGTNLWCRCPGQAGSLSATGSLRPPSLDPCRGWAFL